MAAREVGTGVSAIPRVLRAGSAGPRALDRYWWVGGCAGIFGGTEWDMGRGPESRGTPSLAWAMGG